MYKLLFDQNLSYKIIGQIEHLFPNSNHVRLLKLDKADDLTVWKYAKNNDFHIVSKDTDFNDMNALYGFPPKIIWIDIGNTTTDAIIKLLQKKHELIYEFLDNKETGLLKL
jgi:predicted nuclease of predicted toxin-antitoxin system